MSKTDSLGTTNNALIGDAIDAPMATDGMSGVAYVWGANGLAAERRAGVNKYHHGDALGTTRAITTQAGAQTDTRETDAFGANWNPGTTLATPTPFGFAGAVGYQSDADSGLMMLGHRYYDASVGRFLSRDPIRAGYNWYVYVDNDPVNAVDPTGLKPPGSKTSVVNNSSQVVWVEMEIAKPGNQPNVQIRVPLPPGYSTNPQLGEADHVLLPGGGPDYHHIAGPTVGYPVVEIGDQIWQNIGGLSFGSDVVVTTGGGLVEIGDWKANRKPPGMKGSGAWKNREASLIEAEKNGWVIAPTP